MKPNLSVFGPVWDASGVRNFDGRGWWYHLLLWLFGLRFKGSTFVAKTTTLSPRTGNMPLKADGRTPVELLPSCVKVKWWKGTALNAVGLSGPGVEFWLKSGIWQRRTEPFFISFMAVEKTVEERLQETKGFVELLKRYLPRFRAIVGIQLNLSCPNVGAIKRPREEFVSEASEHLDILAELGVVVIVKFSVTTDIDTARKIAEHPACSGVCISNTVPWMEFQMRIDWHGIFGSGGSPLRHIGGGGLSGKPLFPLVCEWVSEAKMSGFPKPINAGGGILSKRDAIKLFQLGADSVFLGSVAFLRGWRVAGIIRGVNRYWRARR